MNPLRRIAGALGFTLPLLLLLTGLSQSAFSQSVPGRAEVRAISGTATFSTNGGPARPLKAGALLSSGASIKTDAGSSVDLFLGNSAGMIRVGEKTTLQLDKLDFTETGADTAVDVEIGLPDGDMFFNVNKMSKGSRYQIKMPTGVAGIRGTKGRFSFRTTGGLKPPVVLLTGSVIYEHTPPGSPPATFLMTTPPPVYFSATEGVKVAPKELVDEMEQTLKDLGTRIGVQTRFRQTQRNSPVEPFMSPGGGSSARSGRGQPGE